MNLYLEVARHLAAYRERSAALRVGPEVDVDSVRAAFGGPLPDDGEAPESVIERLIAAAEPALVTSTGPRYFGFVIGGSLESSTAADLLTSGWDQNGFTAATSPAAAIAEETAGAWLKALLTVPLTASFGFVTGAQAANTVGLAAARHHVLARAGWDVEEDGLTAAPAVRVIASKERHATIDASLRLLGLGRRALVEVEAGPNGAIDVGEVATALASHRDEPLVVCGQAGNVNTGATDDMAALVDVAHAAGAWVHVDGAFGLWAAASPATRAQVAGVEGADSWACDGHKWLNVPYDSGYVFCAHPEAHAASMAYRAAYLVGHGEGPIRAPSDFVPESSRRARGFATWAALRELGRAGVADLIERSCAHARDFAVGLSSLPGVSIANQVVLNQVLVDFGSAERTDAVIEAVQRDGTCWMGGTTWQGRRLMRISVSNAGTTSADVEQSIAAVERALATVDS